jgi:SP family facilitated glucose transporter-like MFS transporter 3
MGRSELYEAVPFVAVPGLQKKERNLSLAFASFAANLDTLEADDIVTKMTNEPLSNAEKELHRSNANLLLLEELEAEQIMVTIPLIFAVIAASASQFLVGYNTGVMNAPESVVFPGHSTTSWSLAVAAFAVGGPFGAYFAGSLADSRGRRGALMIVVWTFLLGGLLQTFATNMNTIIAARVILGLASGSSSVLVPVYLGEMAPPTLRGTLGTMTQFALVIGILLADVLAFPFATEGSWRILFGVTPALAAIQLLCSPFLLESPRWLLGRDPESRKARFIIKKLRAFRFDHEVETEVHHFVAAAEVQDLDTEESTNSKSAVQELFADRSIRLLVISAIVLQVAQQFSGVNAIFYYSTMFFDGVIDNPLVGTTLVGAVNVLGTWVALLLMDSCGRKTLILCSAAGMFFSCVAAVLALLGYFNNIVALGAVMAYVTFFEIGLGPIPWLIVAEMFDARYVATAMSVCCQINWVCNFIIGLVFPYMNEYLGAYSFGPFAAVLFATFLFTAFVLPETGGTTPEELQAQLVKKNASVVYHNLDITTNHTGALEAEWALAMEQYEDEDED